MEQSRSLLPPHTISEHSHRCGAAPRCRPVGPGCAVASAWRSWPAPGSSSSLSSDCIHQKQGTRQDPGPVARSKSRWTVHLPRVQGSKTLLPEKKHTHTHTHFKDTGFGKSTLQNASCFKFQRPKTDFEKTQVD